MPYEVNPKLDGSGIVGCVPQRGRCPMNCPECFGQSGRGYLEPLDEKTPNVPPPEVVRGRVVRMCDMNDANHERGLVVATAMNLLMMPECSGVFYNTSIPRLDFPGPVVLTANPGKRTDAGPAHLVDPCPPNLMMVRVRTNTWNLQLVDEVVEHYAGRGRIGRKVPVVLTFMAYYSNEPKQRGLTGDNQARAALDLPPADYSWRKRNTNSYWVITPEAWDRVMARFKGHLVYSCGKDADTHGCARCGRCLAEFYATRERMRSQAGA